MTTGCRVALAGALALLAATVTTTGMVASAGWYHSLGATRTG